MESELTRIHLAEAGHAELWGAISVAQAALKQCWFIANRDRLGDDIDGPVITEDGSVE